MKGTVRKIEGDTAHVVVVRQSACGENCGNCGGCTNKSGEIKAKNTLNAKPGDEVVVSMEDKKVLFAAFLFYIVPLIIFFLVYVVLWGVKINNALCIIAGAFAAGVFYLGLHFYDKKQKNKYTHEIIKID